MTKEDIARTLIEELKEEIKDLKAEVDRRNDHINDLERDLSFDRLFQESESEPSIDITTMEEIAFEAEGMKLEGREFGSWLLERMRRFVRGGGV